MEVKKTEISDLSNVQSLWENGQVMHFVGFPEGIYTAYDKMLSWLDRISQKRSV